MDPHTRVVPGVALASALQVLLVAAPVAAAPALPGEPCATPPLAAWSAPERWAWEERICTGRVADFNQRAGEATGMHDPSSSEGWSAQRVLGSAFLETVLLHEPFASAIPRQGVQIRGALLHEPLDLRDARLRSPLSIEDSRLEHGVLARGLHASGPLALRRVHACGTLDLAGVQVAGDLAIVSSQAAAIDLQGARAAGSLLLDGTRVFGLLSLQGVQVDGGLLMRGAVLDSVKLRDARVGKHLMFNEATVRADLEADNIIVGGHVFMRGGRFARVELDSARLENLLTLDGATLSGPLTLDSARIGGNLHMRRASFAEARLRGARIGGQLAMNDSTFEGPVDLESLKVEESLLVQRASFQVVRLNNADVAGVLNADGARFQGKVDADALRVERSAYLRAASFAAVSLRGMRVGGQLELNRSTACGPADRNGSTACESLDLDSIRIERHLFLRDAQFGDTNLVAARVAHGVDLSGSTLGEVNLSSASIGGELIMGSPMRGALTWRPGARLILRNLKVGALRDGGGERDDGWPQAIEFDDFVYGRLGGFAGAAAGDPVTARPVRWFIDWLARDPDYAAQPYRQLARVLAEAGETEKAGDVLYAGRERERRESRGLARVGLTLLKLTVGYGYGQRYFRTLWWVAAFVALGALVLRVTGEGRRAAMPFGIAYSLDMLLPVVRLRDAHYTIDLQGVARYYFYLHKTMGYVLASFLVAGLAGLTS